MRAHYYQAYGLTFASDLSIDFLPSCLPQPTDFAVRTGDVDGFIQGHHFSTQFANWKAGDGCFAINVKGVAQYLVLNGNEIIVQPEPKVTNDSVIAFLISSGFAALLQQRQLLTLHASAIMTAKGAVLFVGPSGIGKSTTMAVLCEKGYNMITDDIAAITTSHDSTAEIVPSFPSIRLRGDTLKKIGKNQNQYLKLRKQVDKFVVPIENFDGSSKNICKIFLLEVHDHRSTISDSLPHAEAFKWLTYFTFRKRFYDGMGLSGFHFNALCKLISATSIYQLKRPDDPNMIDELIREIMSEIGEPTSTQTPSFAD